MLLRSTATFLISLAVTATLLGQTSNPESTAADIEFLQGKVLMVTDGDQIRVKSAEGKVFVVRLHGVDAPETVQAFGANARKALEGFVLGKDVSVVVHRLDSQGRYMGTVFREGQDVGAKLLESGSAWHYKRVSGEQAFDVRARYAKAELKARESNIGLWSEPMPVPPWEFREEVSDREDPAPAQPKVTKVADVSKSQPTPTATDENESGKKYVLGPRGGCYYLNIAGEKVYVKNKSLCPKP